MLRAGLAQVRLACDVVKVVAGEPSWKGDFSLLGALARAHGLIWAARARPADLPNGDWRIVPTMLSLGSFEALRARVANSSRPIAFLFGASLTMPESPGGRGVPDVQGIITRLKEKLSAYKDAVTELQSASLKGNGDAYRVGFELVQRYRGPDAANAVIRDAVLSARMDGGVGAAADGAHPDEVWYLRPSVAALGKVLAQKGPRFAPLVLTTNFDPLIEVAIRRGGGMCHRSVLDNDGSLAGASGEGCHVVYLHGYWSHGDTLHTAVQIGQTRKHLQHSIQNLLEKTTLVVLGYGGWHDVMMKALKNLVSDKEVYFDIVWAFRDADPAQVEAHYAHVLKPFAAGSKRGRVQYYGGIDLHALLMTIKDDVALAGATAAGAAASVPPAVDPTIVVQAPASKPAAADPSGILHQPPAAWISPVARNDHRFKVAAFDLDGTLLRGKDFHFSWEFVWRGLKFGKAIDKALKGTYRQQSTGATREVRVKAYREWCEKACEHFKTRGLTRDQLRTFAKPLTLTLNCREAMKKLRDEGLVIGIVSGGISAVLEDIFPDFRDYVDFVFINELLFTASGALEGVRASAYDFEGKAEALDVICRRAHCDTSEAVFIGDHYNDESAMWRAGKSIAYPLQDAVIGDASTVSVEQDDLNALVPHILGD
jgi:phosphoserine phosphatase